MKSDQDAKIIGENLRLAWGSLESHIWGSYNKTPEGRRFHRACIAEYAQTIINLSKLLK